MSSDLAAVMQSATFVGPELPASPATSTAGGSTSTDRTRHTRPIDHSKPEAIIELMRETMPGATIRTRGDAIVCNGNEFVCCVSAPGVDNRYTAQIDGVRHILSVQAKAGDVTRYHRVGDVRVFTDMTNGAWYNRCTQVGDKTTDLDYENGKLVRKIVTVGPRTRTVTYSPICDCGEHHVERIEIVVKAELNARKVLIFAPPAAPDAYTCVKVKHGRLASDYSYAGPDMKTKHGSCTDYYADSTSREVYDMGRCTSETTEFTDAAGVVHCNTVVHEQQA